MRYIIKYFDRVNRDKPKEERILKLELNDSSSLADAIRLLQQNKYVIISAELVEVEEVK